MANKVFNMAGGRHSAAAYSAFEDALYGSCVATDSDFVATAGTGMTVQLTSGNGLISTGSGYARRIQADSTNTITITAASATLPRTDSIVAYIDNAVTPVTSVTDNTNNILRFVAVAGTPASTPSAPSAVTIQSAVGAGNPYMVLWDVTIPAGATAMNTAVFTDQRQVAKFEIADGSITSSKLASNAVTTGKINAKAVTGGKIDFSTVTSAMLEDIPTGTATATDYIKFTVGTVNTLNAFRFGNIVMVNWDVSGVGAVAGQKVLGTATTKIVNTAYGAGRVSGGSATIPATLVAIPGGELRLMTTGTGTGTAGTIWLFVND